MDLKSFNYTQLVIAKLANPSPTDYLQNHMDFFRSKLIEQNERSAESPTNRRYVEIVEDKEQDLNQVTLKIYSEVELGIPGRAFTGFSRSLVPQKKEARSVPEYDPFFDDNLFHGKLLVFQRVLDQEKDTSSEISNEEMLQALLHLSFLPQSTLPDGKKKAIKQIKNILVNSGIYQAEAREEE